MSDTLVQDDTAARLNALVADAPGGPAWAGELRAAAAAEFLRLPLPSRALHLWRYSDPESLLPGDRSLRVAEDDASFDFDAERFSARLRVVDGRVVGAATDASVAGLTVGDVLDPAHAELAASRVGSLAGPNDAPGRKFERLSAALFTGGPLVHLRRGTVAEHPILIDVHTTGDGVAASRGIVVAESGTEATVVFELTSDDPDAAPLYHEGIELFVEAGARLRCVWVQRLGRKVIHAPVIRARVQRDARLEHVVVSLGSGQGKSLMVTELVEPAAETDVLGIVFGGGRQHFDHHTIQDHIAPNTNSTLDFRAVVGGRSRSAYTGNLRIGLDGAGCEAHQSNHNLLLSRRARADSIPELEILTDEVRCSHAAASGPLDPDQIYYCMSRGYDRDEALKLIIRGFMEPTVSKVPEGPLLERVREALDERLDEVRA